MIDQAYINSYMADWRKYGTNSPATLEQRGGLAKIVGMVIRKYEVLSIIDAPCGDFDHYMGFIDLKYLSYSGYDINTEVIKRNRLIAKSHHASFNEADIVNWACPHGHMIVCREFLFHMTLDNALKTIANFKASGSKYLLATTHGVKANTASYQITSDHPEWGYRALNLSLPPFDLGQPIASHLDPVVAPSLKRSLAVWRMN